MLNIYDYHTNPTSLKSPSTETSAKFKQERDERLKYFFIDLYALEDDYDCTISRQNRQDGSIAFTMRSPKVANMTFVISAHSVNVYAVDNIGNITETVNIDDVVDLIVDELQSASAYRNNYEDEDDYEEENEDEYDD